MDSSSTGGEIMKDVSPIVHTITSATIKSNFSRSRLYKGMKSGRLLFKKVGKRTMIMPDDLERFVIEELNREPAILNGGEE